ncbi:SusC/RagA family TonB-linked outer membrane protein [Mucilaginibacter sp. UYCu711]|uniref:SusC/RagA family TonB-linked outer membrane protein n=1 Tax=Mucilaginibacter sp. UYCu711 TaxID=3156339 RepID=UPI003D20EB46
MYKKFTQFFCTPEGYIHKFLLIMKLTAVLIIATLLQVSAASFAQKITYVNSSASLKQIFIEIQKQTGYDILISGDALNTEPNQVVNFNRTPLKEVLDKSLQGLSLTYEIEGKTILIKEKSFFSKILAAVSAKNVNGNVVDKEGNPLVGATVIVLGTTNSTSTSLSGSFSLTNVDEGATIRFSYIGYISRDIKASADLSVIKLEIGNSKLDEVKVIAYGTTTQRLSTGSQGSINAADIEKQPVNNILDALVGRIAGLQITQTSGISGAAPKVKIRGQTSILATTDPLYILDGVPVSSAQALTVSGALDNRSLNLLTSLNTTDIESVTVLKDADATAIYGSRGANGVILITTKRGKVGKMAINIRASTGIQRVGNRLNLLDVNQFLAMRKEAFANDVTYGGSTTVPTVTNAPDLLLWDQANVHDWQKEFISKTAVSNDLGLSISGGNENTKYLISAGYHKEGTVMPGDSKFIRKSLAANISSSSENKKFNMEARTTYSETTINLLPTDLVQSIFLAPHYPIYNSDGSPNWTYTTFPLSYTLQHYYAPTTNIGINGLMSYEFIHGLKLKLTGGFNTTTLKMSQEQPLGSFDPTSSSATATLDKQTTDNKNWILEPQLEYSHTFNKHHITALLGSTFQETKYNSLLQKGTNFPNDNLISNIGSAGTITTSSQYTPYNYNAFFGRLSYDFNQEVLANVTFRRDGSSRFGPGNKFGNFGAVGLGWIFTQREWIKDNLPFLSYGKIRGSYGITGNDGIGDFAYLNTYFSGFGGYNGSPGLVPAGIANPDLHWETTKKLEAALELGFLNDRILLSGTYFRNRSGNQLVSNNVSTQTGFFNYPANFPGLVQNKGYELELNTKNIAGAFTWNTSFNFSKSDNKLVEYPDFASSAYTFRYALGESLNVIKAYQLAGLNAKGLPIYKLANGTTGEFPGNDDRIIAGAADPMYGGISNEFSYKGFTFSFFIRYERQVGVPAYYPNNNVGGSSTANWSTFVLGRWQKPGDEANTIIPRFTRNFAYQSFYYLSADQLIQTRHIFRLSNAALAYTLPAAFSSKLKMKRVQLYVNGQNLYVFDQHRAYELDPLTGNQSLPPLRTIIFGMNASF